MSTSGSVTDWIHALKLGDNEAAQQIWERYYSQLVGLSRHKLQMAKRREADEEDVVQNAFHSFFRGVARGRFPRLDDRDNLWRLLVVITMRKALDLLAREKCREGKKDDTLPAWQRIYSKENQSEEELLRSVICQEPTPDIAAEVVEQYRRLLDQLNNDGLSQVAMWKMEGYTNDEIASMLDCSRRTVARKLETIRIIWTREPNDGQSTPLSDSSSPD